MMGFERDPWTAIDGRVPQSVPRVRPHDAPVVMVVGQGGGGDMGEPYTLAGQCHTGGDEALLQQPRPVTEAAAGVHLLPALSALSAHQAPGAAAGVT